MLVLLPESIESGGRQIQPPAIGPFDLPHQAELHARSVGLEPDAFRLLVLNPPERHLRLVAGEIRERVCDL